MTTYAWLKRQGQQYRESQKREAEDRERTRMMEDKQMQLLDAEINNMMNQGGVSEEVRKMAQQQATDYLGKWNQTLQKAEGMYSTAVSQLDEAGKLIDRTYGDLDELDAVGEEIKGEWSSFKEQFGGMQGELLESGGQSIRDRGELQRRFMEVSKGDPEQAAARAMTDVGVQQEAGRKAEALRLQGLGIDPTSGRARSFMNESRTQGAVGQVMAGNVARRGEKERIAGITAQGMGLIDPTKDIGAAADIQRISSDLLSQRSQMATTKAGLATGLAQSRGQLATTTANIGSSMARDIGGQYGEYGAAQQGIAYGNTGTSSSSTGGGSDMADRRRLGITHSRPLTTVQKKYLEATR